jgi:hypothetical protein
MSAEIRASKKRAGISKAERSIEKLRIILVLRRDLRLNACWAIGLPHKVSDHAITTRVISAYIVGLILSSSQFIS